MSIPINNSCIKLVLFDLGGVLVELGDELFPSSWFAEAKEFKLAQWFTSEAAIKFETGLISVEEFLAELKHSLSLSATDEDIYAAFKNWPKGLLPHTQELVERLASKYSIAVLSNSNVIHETVLLNNFGLKNMIDDIFFSHLIGYSKPDSDAFLYVLNSLDVQPSEVMFFDDNEANVLAAQNLGINAHQVRSPAEVTQFI